MDSRPLLITPARWARLAIVLSRDQDHGQAAIPPQLASDPTAAPGLSGRRLVHEPAGGFWPGCSHATGTAGLPATCCAATACPGEQRGEAAGR